MRTLLYLAFFFVVVALCIAVETLSEDETLEDEALTVEDFYEYFETQNMEDTADAFEIEKRARRKVGPCKAPNGLKCELCNLKIRNKQNKNRYILCRGGKSKDRTVI